MAVNFKKDTSWSPLLTATAAPAASCCKQVSSLLRTVLKGKWYT